MKRHLHQETSLWSYNHWDKEKILKYEEEGIETPIHKIKESEWTQASQYQCWKVEDNVCKAWKMRKKIIDNWEFYIRLMNCENRTLWDMCALKHSSPRHTFWGSSWRTFSTNEVRKQGKTGRCRNQKTGSSPTRGQRIPRMRWREILRLQSNHQIGYQKERTFKKWIEYNWQIWIYWKGIKTSERRFGN